MMEPELQLVLFFVGAAILIVSVGGFIVLAGTWIVRTARIFMMDVDARKVELQAANVGITSLQADVQDKLTQIDLNANVIRPDDNGLYPIHRSMIDNGMSLEAALKLALARIEAQRTFAPTPTHLTYAPHVKGGDGVQVAPPAALLEEHDQAARDFFQLYQSDQLPKDKFLIGFDLEDGEPVIAGWSSLYSALIGGQSGSGKSTLIRNVLAQSALQGGRFAILDPHFASGDESLGASLMPLRKQMLFDVASNDAEMLQALRYVADVGRNRLSGKDSDRTPLVLIVDETTALLSRGAISDQLLAVLEMIAQETRKVGVYAMCIGQQFSAETMKTTARNSFVSMLSCKARRDVARMQSGNIHFAKIAEKLTLGQAVWMAPTGEIVSIAVPNTTQRHLESVGAVISAQKDSAGVWSATGVNMVSSWLPDDCQNNDPEAIGQSTGNQPAIKNNAQSPVILDAKAQRAIAMFMSGKTIAEIVKEVWNVHTGRAYTNAIEEVQAILRAQIGGAR